VVTEDQLSLAIGKRGQNVRLAARLTNWDIDILTPAEFNAGLDVLEKTLREVEGVDSTIVDQIIAMGMVNVLDVEEVGPQPLINELQLPEDLAKRIVEHCTQAARKVAEQQAKEKEQAAQELQAEQQPSSTQDQAPSDQPEQATSDGQPQDQADQPEQLEDRQGDSATGAPQADLMEQEKDEDQQSSRQDEDQAVETQDAEKAAGEQA